MQRDRERERRVRERYTRYSHVTALVKIEWDEDHYIKNTSVELPQLTTLYRTE